MKVSISFLGTFYRKALACLKEFFRRPPSTPDTPPGLGRAWKAVACRYRRWFKAELAGSLHLKRDHDAKGNRVWLLEHCAFCDFRVSEGAHYWLESMKRYYCQDCKDRLDAEDQAEAEAMVGDKFAVRGVNRKDFL